MTSGIWGMIIPMPYLLVTYLLAFLLLLAKADLSAAFAAPVFLLIPLLHPSMRQGNLHPGPFPRSQLRVLTYSLILLIFSIGMIGYEGGWERWALHTLWVIIPEEFFFRLFFYKVLDYEDSSSHLIGRRILWNSFIFMGFHLLNSISLANLLILFPGLLLAYVFLKYRNLTLNCCLHLAMNVFYSYILLPRGFF